MPLDVVVKLDIVYQAGRVAKYAPGLTQEEVDQLIKKAGRTSIWMQTESGVLFINVENTVCIETSLVTRQEYERFISGR
jgi:hypothetical protein